MRSPLRAIFAAAWLLGVTATVTPTAQRHDAAPFPVVETDIASLQRAMQEGRTTSRAITAAYLARIARYEPTLNAVITLNPRALAEADVRDRERRQGRVRGALHGIPIALKDNIQTLDLPTTGGALAFARLRPPYEATIARQLRTAGAIILAKTTMTELANWVSSWMPPGYSSLAGFSFNPYDPRPDPRARGADPPPLLTPGGSSSGIGTAASFWAANVGTETSGSILNPSGQTMLVGIKPTVGRVSRYGVIPISADQDTPGPMARTVADAALMLDAMQSAAPDPNDPATRRCPPASAGEYRRHQRSDGRRGARIGVPRAFFYDPVRSRGTDTGGLTPPQRDIMVQAIDAIRGAGATIVDPADLPSIAAEDPAGNLLAWPICIGGADAATGRDARCSIVLQYGMKRDFNRWLASLGKAAPVPSLRALRAWNQEHAGEGTLRFGQDQLDASDDVNVDADRARYEADRRKDLALAATNGIDAAMKAHGLDALLFPSYLGSWVSARAGYPSVIVPFGLVPERLRLSDNDPDSRPSPFGVTFSGGACSEPRLIELAYAFEQATRRRVAPFP